MEIRLNKFISDSGYCSRREADRMIEKQKVTINGRVAQVGDRLYRGDQVRVNGNLIEHDNEVVYIALNKPVGIVSTTDPSERNNIVNLVNYPTRIFNIGRLDKDSEGLILLTNDGDIVNKILRASNNHEKEYLVQVDKPITEAFLKKMASGVPILGTMTKKCRLEQVDVFRFRITLTQGLNRQIRRMCEALGYEVVALRRERIMHIRLDRLERGHWRDLTPEEVGVLMESLKESSGEQSASPNRGSRPGQSPRKSPSSAPLAPSRPARSGASSSRSASSTRSTSSSRTSSSRPGNSSRPGAAPSRSGTPSRSARSAKPTASRSASSSNRGGRSASKPRTGGKRR